jgi:putative transcriptional regulator
MPESFQGHLLAAVPELRDPNFARSVVLLVQHNEEGAFGLVINRPTDARLRDVWNQVSEAPCRREDKLHVGGPVEGPLMALHQHQTCSEKIVIPDVHFCSGRDHLEQLVAEDGPVKFFAGFAGWGSGQLEGEMSENSWLILPARPAMVFSNDPSLWEEIVRQAANARMVDMLKIRHVPPDPTMN